MGWILEACPSGVIRGRIWRVEDGRSGSEGIWIQRLAMSMRILVEQLNGDTMRLKVTPHTTVREVKEQLKGMHTWEDELSCATTVVELIVGNQKVTNEETVEELGLRSDSKVTVVFRKNVVQCSNKSSFGPDLDPEALVIVEIPDSVTEIEKEAFADCRRMAKVIIPSRVTSIGDGAFSHCSSLASVSIPDSVTWMADYVFRGCSALTEVTVPDSITCIGARAFAGCTSLRSVSIPDSVTRIGTFAFKDCSSLVSVNIPDSVMQIGAGAFDFCSGLTLTAPMRLLGRRVSDCCKMVPKKCGCGRCDWTRFRDGLPCPAHRVDWR